MTKLKLSWPLRFCVSALIIGLILWFVPTGQLWNAVRGISLHVWLLVLVVFLLGHVVGATKWWLMTCREGDIPWTTALRAHFAGLLANLCLPGVAGGDVIRAAWVMKMAKSPERVGVASVADRMLDCVALLVLACCGALWAIKRSGPITVPLIIAGSFIIGGILSVALVQWVLHRTQPTGILQRIADALTDLRQQPARLLACLLLSGTVQSTFVVLNIVLGSATGVVASADAWFVAWPLAKLIAVIPISLAGLGVRETSLVALFQLYGAAAAPVVAAGILWQSVLFSAGLFGGLLVAMAGRIHNPTLVSAREATS